MVSYTDFLENETYTYQSDEINKTTTIIASNGNSFTYSYNEDDNLKSVKNKINSITYLDEMYYVTPEGKSEQIIVIKVEVIVEE